MKAKSHGAIAVWRLLLLAQFREQPARLLITVVAIALGVALGTAVYLVNGAALNEFGLATKRLVGEADIIVRGPREGFPEKLFTELAGNASIKVVSPVLELEVALDHRSETLKVLGLDPFRAAALQPAIIGDIGANLLELLRADSIYLSSSAAHQLALKRGDELPVRVGSDVRTLRVLGVLSEGTYPESLGVMDIASAQWMLQRLGVLNRLDLRLAPGVDVEAFRRKLGTDLPPGVLAIAPSVERDRAVTVTRAYRVNLNMLALVALWTGAFLVFSTQSLSVLRRRRSLALLRALGVTRLQLQRALVGEGAALGIVGAFLGVLLGAVIASLILRVLTGDLGNGQLRAAALSLRAAPLPMMGFFLVGTAVAAMGAWLPARTASRQHPARALKGGDGDYSKTTRAGWRSGVLLLAIGTAMAWLPPVAGLPVFGYAAIGALLFGAVLLVPALTVIVLRVTPRTRQTIFDTAVAQLRENVSLSALSLASIIVSFSLMVAMAIMVYSFRVSFDHWLGKLLPADLQLREPLGSDTAYWSLDDQSRLASTPGVAKSEFRRTRQMLIDPSKPPITLIARGASETETAAELPLLNRATASPQSMSSIPKVWISEALQDLYGYQVGERLLLPIAGRNRSFEVAGVWRDYARTFGALVISRPAYVQASGDDSASEASMWLKEGADAASVQTALRERLSHAGALEITTTTALHERSLQIFDRAFIITYALEAIAVIIGLAGVSFAASSTALARRAEFGVLRHIGMLRRQVIGLIASEGVLTSTFGVLYGLTLGVILSLVLVYVINRQSFNWSIDLAIPVEQLIVLSLSLIAAAALTAIWSGRAAMSQEAVQAVREDGSHMKKVVAFVVSILMNASACAASAYLPVTAATSLQFPADFGSHPSFRIEWWYVTGWLKSDHGEDLGFQVTFFRTKPDIDENNPSAFLPRQLLIAHAALSDPKRGQLWQDQRIRRAGMGLVEAKEGDTAVWIDGWSLRHTSSAYDTVIQAEDFALLLHMVETQSVLVNGAAGVSRKGPDARAASFYYSLPHLKVTGQISRKGSKRKVTGEAWFDHEWSSEYLDPQAIGWDWIGINLDDGGALMAFVIRDANGGQHWAGGTYRDPSGHVETLEPAEVAFTPERNWTSPRTGIVYPVRWKVRAGSRTWSIEPLLDDQENDTRLSTGAIYWEGAVRAVEDRRVVGRGYLELTGYGERLTLR